MHTHEAFINGVYRAVLARCDARDRAILECLKLAYGAGPRGTRGVTYFARWSNAPRSDAVPFVEVCAFGQSSHCQLAGTTIHELAHALAGFGAGHGAEWKAACIKLGLRVPRAAGMAYHWANFAPDLRAAIVALPIPTEGQPIATLHGGVDNGLIVPLKPCTAGVGTRGGKSRGTGSGSRYRLWCCECDPPVKVRVASDHFRAHCDDCAKGFTRR